jgi:glycosyltransferase involved in cell wall biosynthesis
VTNGLTFVISADYERATGGWIYDQRLLEGLARLGWRIHRVTLPAGFPNPSDEARAESAAAFARIADGMLVLADQLCLGVLPEVARAAATRLRLVMIVHHPLALENVRAPRESEGLARSEREALSHCTTVIATSNATARILATGYAVPYGRIVVAEPGVDRQPITPFRSTRTRGPGSFLSSRCSSPGSRDLRAPEQADGWIPGTRPGMTRACRIRGSAINLLCIGAVVPRKDHGALVSALAGLRHLPWRLTIVGNMTRAPRHVARLRAQIAASGLESRVRLAGQLPSRALARHWLTTDVYVAASRHEGYGMAIAEAFAHGVPVVTTRAGAVGQWIGRGGALVVPNGNTAQFKAALARVLSQPALRASLRRGAIARRLALPTWDATATAVHQRLLQL